MIRERIEDNQNHLLYSVSYHPETNSIEEFFSQLKHYIKKESPNTYEDIDTTIKGILENKIRKEHLINYWKHSFKLRKEDIQVITAFCFTSLYHFTTQCYAVLRSAFRSV